MQLELTREDIAKAIRKYVLEDVLDYKFKQNNTDFEIEIVQGQKAKATVVIKEKEKEPEDV